MDRQQEIILEIKEINRSDLNEVERSAKIINLSRELGKLLLEERLIKR